MSLPLFIPIAAVAVGAVVLYVLYKSVGGGDGKSD